MALTPCPECGRMVSPNAERCPGCGTPIKQQVTKKTQPTNDKVDNFITVIFVTFIAMLFIVIMFVL